jgi:uncharacterized membrane protein YedE/YeeE
VIDEADLPGLQLKVLWATFAVTFLVGLVMARTNFCTMGAVSDIVNMGDWSRMKMWVGAIGVAIVGSQALHAAGLVDLGKSFYTVPRLVWTSHLVGGFLFGFGMVLASGCTSKTLIRIGGGSLKSLTVFVVLGVAAYMTLKGLVAVARVATVDRIALDLGVGQDLPRLLQRAAGLAEGSLPTVHLALGLAVGLVLLIYAFGRREQRVFDVVVGAAGVGLGVTAIWWISGHLGHLAEHPRTLEEAFLATNSGRLESLSFVAPMAYTIELLMYWSDTSRTLSIGIVAALGMVAGAFAHALATKSFRWEGFAGTEDTANHLVGAILMGVGGVTAVGCTVGQGLSSLSTLAVGGFISFLAIVTGARVALAYQEWRVMRSL